MMSTVLLAQDIIGTTSASPAIAGLKPARQSRIRLVESEIVQGPELLKVSAFTVDNACPIGVDVKRNRA